MKYSEIEGFVLSYINLGEADRIITIFTFEEGKLKAIAKGVRRSKAKLSGHLEPFTKVKIRLTKGRNLDIIIGAQAIQVFDFSALSQECLYTAYIVLETINQLSMESQANKAAYELIQEVFSGLKDGVNPLITRQYFGLRFLATIGSQPDLSDTKLGVPHYLVYDSGLISRAKPNGHYGIISVDTIKLWRLLLSSRLISLSRLTKIASPLKEGEQLLMRYYEYHFDLVFRSTKVFQEYSL